MQLRPYQQAALEAVRAAFGRSERRTLVVMPTGTGKTVLFAEIARLAKGPVLVLAHRQEPRRAGPREDLDLVRRRRRGRDGAPT